MRYYVSLVVTICLVVGLMSPVAFGSDTLMEDQIRQLRKHSNVVTISAGDTTIIYHYVDENTSEPPTVNNTPSIRSREQSSIKNSSKTKSESIVNSPSIRSDTNQLSESTTEFFLRTGNLHSDLDYSMSYRDATGDKMKSTLKFPINAKTLNVGFRTSVPIDNKVSAVLFMNNSKDVSSQTTKGEDFDWTNDHLDFYASTENELEHYFDSELGVGLEYYHNKKFSLGMNTGIYYQSSQFIWTAFKQQGYDTFNKPWNNISGDTLAVEYERQIWSPFVEVQPYFKFNDWIHIRSTFTYLPDVHHESEDQHLLISKISWIESKGDGYQFSSTVFFRPLRNLNISLQMGMRSYETSGTETAHYINTEYYDRLSAQANGKSTFLTGGLSFQF